MSEGSQRIVAVKGMNDLLPGRSHRVEWLESRARELFARYAYRNIRTPIVETTPLFVRGLGEVTDVVEKEMYSFEDRLNGDPLTLRPEATAGVVRAAIEHNLLYDGGKRLYYMGPMFRHERPQKGRYRQFDQIGAEAMGFAGPEVDAELIVMAAQLLHELGLRDLRLELNSLGISSERSAHRMALIAYFERHLALLDADARRRLHSNPLRVLDSKNPAMRAVIDNAPRLFDFLGPESRTHFDRVLAILDANGIACTIQHRLVRGLDYYTKTVFEFITDQLGAQGTVCAGGRYDGLFAQLGGKPTPAVGWAMGMDRVLDLLDDTEHMPDTPVPDAYAIVAEPATYPEVLRVLQELRRHGVCVQMHADTAGASSLKSQFKRADASGATYALVFAQDEMAHRQVAIKHLRDASIGQILRPVDDIANWAPTLQSRPLSH
ncbi:histidine--tRNA ligase [Candidatus Symbiobacter mobilis]|uniref:Histidine--tRNA ligase n=1 Tax=Candidatus Symbiobacter mobilis CR TaxID=946483 RepID=U5N8R6_9BURK|nr:histidine--tRNA ligase [Candidatus Symbiobacter mobilis]AGX87926.1 histidyl-tRNA synthetase [Candidatus Symbiobacter mobilis CR]